MLLMSKTTAGSQSKVILRLVDTFDGRDELFSCLDFIGHAQDQNPDLLNSLTLSVLPSWLEEHGFRSDLFGRFFEAVDLATALSSPPETLFSIFSSLAPDMSALQLVDAVANRSPNVYAALLEAIEVANQSGKALGSVAGGVKKWEAASKDVLAGVGALSIIGGAGYGGFKLVSHIRHRLAEAREREVEAIQEQLKTEQENAERKFHAEVTDYFLSGKANKEQARLLGIRIQEFYDDPKPYIEFVPPRQILEKRMLDILFSPSISQQDLRFRQILEKAGVGAKVQTGERVLNAKGKVILSGAASRMTGWSEIHAFSNSRAADYLKTEEFEELAGKLFTEQLKLIDQDVRKKIVAEVDSEVKLVVENELSNATKEVEIIVEVERKA
jgi:hypothetical protein